MSYIVLVFLRLLHYRHEFSQILTSSTTTSHASTRSRFYRLYAYTIICILVLLPVNFYILYMNLKVPRQPYSWVRVHDPKEWAVIFRLPYIGEANFDRWIDVGAGFLMFGFFGMGSEAVRMYKGWFGLVGLGRLWEGLMRDRNERRRVRESRL